MYLYQVPYHLLVQLLFSLTSICFPNKILISGVLISYSSITAKFLYAWLLAYHPILSAISVSLLDSSSSDHSLLVLLSAILVSTNQLLATTVPVRYFFQLIYSTLLL